MENEKKYKAVLFDLDGTLLDTLEDLTDSVNAILEKYGYPKRERKEIRQFLGNGSRKLMEQSLPETVEQEKFEQLLTEYTVYYRAHMEEKTKPYDGILPLLDMLRERKIGIGVVSNKFDTAVKGLCEKYFLGKVDQAAGEQEALGIRRKPAPDMVLAAAEKMGVKREHCLYVGDSEVDLQTAENAGMDCVSVCWGFRDEKFLRERGAERLIHYPEELLKYTE